MRMAAVLCLVICLGQNASAAEREIAVLRGSDVLMPAPVEAGAGNSAPPKPFLAAGHFF